MKRCVTCQQVIYETKPPRESLSDLLIYLVKVHQWHADHFHILEKNLGKLGFQMTTDLRMPTKVHCL